MPDTTRIDDQYWLKYKRTQADTAITRRDEAAAKLQSLSLWLWALYTSVGAIGFGLSGKSLSREQTWLIAFASGAIILVYWSSTWVLIPRVERSSGNAPEEIAEEFARTIQAKQNRLKLTQALSLIAAVMVSVAVIVASMPAKDAVEKRRLDDELGVIRSRRAVEIERKMGSLTEQLAIEELRLKVARAMVDTAKVNRDTEIASAQAATLKEVAVLAALKEKLEAEKSIRDLEEALKKKQGE